jgi:hypothetical protein
MQTDTDTPDEMTPEQWAVQRNEQLLKIVNIRNATDRITAMREFNARDDRFNGKNVPAAETKPLELATNTEIEKDIREYRSANPELHEHVTNMSREKLETTYVRRVMEQKGMKAAEDRDVDAYRRLNPALSEYAGKLPRERLENDYVLTQMRSNGYNLRIPKLKAWFGKPENAEAFAELQKTVAHIADPIERDKVMWRYKAPAVQEVHRSRKPGMGA